MDATQIVTFATPIIVPLIIAGMKWLKPNIPTWLLPVLCGPLGMLLDYINHLVTNSGLNLIQAALLGVAGIGVREIVDQLKPTPAEPKD